MKKAYIIHGWEGNPNDPAMPDTNTPKIENWIPFLQELIKNPDEETILIGHSIGCQAILRYLQSLPEGKKIGGAVLLAGFTHLKEESYENEEDREIAKPWLEIPINWEKVKSKSNKFISIFSTDDFFVPLSDKDIFKESLGSEIIVEENKGHFSPEDNISELPSLLNSVLKLSK
jgi:predicted alpha/beta hydrolase family esterase